MAIYHCQIKPISRASGKTSVAASAYRAGEKLTEKDGKAHDYSKRSGVEYTALVLPAGVEMTREELWQAAEAAEKRKDSRTAREVEIALPAELTQEQRRELATDFAKSIVEKYGVAADVAIHEPSRKGDQRNHHAHILLTTRIVSSAGFEAKSDLELKDKDLRAQGKPSGREQIEALRADWAAMCNSALERAGHNERVSEKSLAEQGIDREATVHLGPSATAMERRGEQTDLGDINREIEREYPKPEPIPMGEVDEEATKRAEADRRARADDEELREKREAEAERQKAENEERAKLAADPDAQVRYVVENDLDPRTLDQSMPFVDTDKLRSELQAAADNPEAWGVSEEAWEAWGERQEVGRVRQVPTPSGMRSEIVYDNF